MALAGVDAVIVQVRLQAARLLPRCRLSRSPCSAAAGAGVGARGKSKLLPRWSPSSCFTAAGPGGCGAH